MKRRIITTYLMVFALAFGAAAQTNAAAGADPAKAATLPAPPPEPKSVAGPEYIIGETMRCMFRCGRNQT